MALQSNAALLDELMGKNRNIAPGACINQVKFDDEDVCKYYLVEFCPHDLFVNTRADLGPCNKIHDDELKKQYEKSSRYGRLGFEEDYERFLRSLLNDVERKIKRGNDRLKLTQTDSDKKTPIQLKQERVAELKEIINRMIKEAESLGEECKIEEAQKTLEECEKYKTECKYLENQLDLALNNQDHKQMEVCNVCGSFLIVNDAQSRVEEHVSGKQHMGYAKLRSALEDIRKKRLEELEKREKEREQREKERERDRDRDRDRERDRDRRDRRDRDHDRERDRDRYRRDKDRDRSRERRKSSRSRSPSKSLSKRNGSSSSSLNNHRESRDRDKDRKSDSYKSKRSRSRSRSKDKKHHRSENGTKTESKEEKVNKLEQQTDEFLKMVDNLTSNNNKKEKNLNEEKEEGEEDDDMDEGEIRGA